MIIVHDTSSECALQMYEVSLKYLLRLSNLERTRNNIANDQMPKKYPKNIQSRVMVFVHYTLSYCALEVYEVSTK